MPFLDAPYLPPSHLVKDESRGRDAIWSVSRQDGPSLEALQPLGHVVQDRDLYRAHRMGFDRVPYQTHAFAALEEALLWISQTLIPKGAVFGWPSFGPQMVDLLWQHDRGYHMVDPSSMPSAQGKQFLPPYRYGQTPPEPLALMGGICKRNPSQTLYEILPKPVLWLGRSYLDSDWHPVVGRTKGGWSVQSSHQRITRKYLDDLLLKVVQDTYTTLPNTPADARPQDQEEALASLYGVEERATTYFEQFEVYKATLQRET